MVITAKSGLNISSAAKLVSYPQAAGQNICVSFWYHVFGNSIGMLSSVYGTVSVGLILFLVECPFAVYVFRFTEVYHKVFWWGRDGYLDKKRNSGQQMEICRPYFQKYKTNTGNFIVCLLIFLPLLDTEIV